MITGPEANAASVLYQAHESAADTLHAPDNPHTLMDYIAGCVGAAFLDAKEPSAAWEVKRINSNVYRVITKQFAIDDAQQAYLMDFCAKRKVAIGFSAEFSHFKK